MLTGFNYSVLLTFDKEKQNDVQQWFTEDHFPKMWKTDCFQSVSYKMVPANDSGAIFRLHMFEFTSNEARTLYEDRFKPLMIEEFVKRWEDDVNENRLQIVRDFAGDINGETIILYQRPA